MAKVVVKSKTKKIKKKFPVEFVAPEFLNSKSLGHSNVSDLNTLVGKTSKMNMMYISGNVKNQNVRLVFKVMEVNSGLAKTNVVEYSQIPYYLGRFVKSGSDLIEDSFVVTSKDGIDVRVKPFVVTKKNTSQMTISALRLALRDLVAKEAASKEYSEFISSVVFSKIQTTFRNEIKKIFPVKVLEFRKVNIEE